VFLFEILLAGICDSSEGTNVAAVGSSLELMLEVILEVVLEVILERGLGNG
jgi:hypothetical protein